MGLRASSPWSGRSQYADNMKDAQRNPVFLVSSAGRRVELLRTLRQGFSGLNPRIVAVDSSPLVPARYEADAFHVVPSVDSPSFRTALSQIVQENLVTHVIPTIDTELAAFAEMKESDILSPAEIFVSSPSALKLAQDKLAFAGFLETKGLPAIRTASLEGGTGQWNEFPAFVKPRQGSSAVGSRVVDSSANLGEADFVTDLIIQPLRNGPEFTIDFAVGNGGKLLGFSIRERLKVRAGEVIVSATREIPEVEALLVRFVACFPTMFGVLNLQVVLANERYEILELNARVGGGYPLSFNAGCDLFGALIKGLEPENLRARAGLLMLRHDTSIFVSPEEVLN